MSSPWVPGPKKYLKNIHGWIPQLYHHMHIHRNSPFLVPICTVNKQLDRFFCFHSNTKASEIFCVLIFKAIQTLPLYPVDTLVGTLQQLPDFVASWPKFFTLCYWHISIQSLTHVHVSHTTRNWSLMGSSLFLLCRSQQTFLLEVIVWSLKWHQRTAGLGPSLRWRKKWWCYSIHGAEVRETEGEREREREWRKAYIYKLKGEEFV